MKRQHPDNPDLFWCPKCKTYKARGEFEVDRRKGNYPRLICKRCKVERRNKWAREHPSDWPRKNKERIKEIKKRNAQKQITNVTDSYIRNQLLNTHKIQGPNISFEIIELKRQQIIMKRTLKQFKAWRKEYESNNTDVQREQRTDEEVNGGQGHDQS